jgi:hypothetical protein
MPAPDRPLRHESADTSSPLPSERARPIVRRAALQAAALLALAGGEAVAGSPRRRRRSGSGSSVSSDTVVVRVFNGTYSSNTNSITAGSNQIQVAVASGSALPTDFVTVERGQVQQFEVRPGNVQVGISKEASPEEASQTARTYYLSEFSGGSTAYVLADYRIGFDADDNPIDIYTVKIAPKGVTF